MWRFETRIGAVRTAAAGTWEEMRACARKAALAIPDPERPTIMALIAEANPEKPWSCTGAACSSAFSGTRR